QPISYPYVIEADIMVAMFQTAYDKYIGQVREGGIVVYDDQLVSPHNVDSLKQVPVPATRTAIEELKNEIVANMVMLGAAVGITGLVTKDALCSAIAETVAERLRELDLKAVAAGFRLGGGKST
ncbi:MAG TPA: 2-oxoacid:acceptor oxidoreductase family protein, partial [Dehalococcoidales bacterium]|nr:2-oxoacid:acceptor oxidoreductase family protein [Dehalococcoidales bacterium]